MTVILPLSSWAALWLRIFVGMKRSQCCDSEQDSKNRLEPIETARSELLNVVLEESIEPGKKSGRPQQYEQEEESEVHEKCQELMSKELGSVLQEIKQSQDDDPNVAPFPINTSKFTVKEVISNSSILKRATILCNCKDTGEDVVVVLNKQGWSNDEMELFFRACNTIIDCKNRNDVYYSYTGSMATPTMVSGTIIWPASQSVIAKYRPSVNVIFEESFEIYIQKVKPYMLTTLDNNKWITNIFDGVSEKNRVYAMVEDSRNSFVVVADERWDNSDAQNVYLLAIAKETSLYSIRDLDGSWLHLLKEMRLKAIEIMSSQFEICQNKVRMYLHYQPSFYRLHVHINITSMEVNNTDIGRAHYLDDVISNISMDPEYYQKRTIRYSIREGSPLYKKLVDDS